MSVGGRVFVAACVLVLAACQSEGPGTPYLGEVLDASTSADAEDSSTGEDTDEVELQCTPEAGLTLYERRIAPLLEDDRPSTCNQCHLSGVDLSLYLQDTPCATMACMAEEGVVDLESPEDSVVLSWIDRAVPSGGITEQTIATERQAMLDWIQMVSTCETEVCEPVEEPCGEPPSASDCEFPPPVSEPMGLDDPGDCSDLTMELVWREKVYAWRSRCYPCHFDSHQDSFEEAVKWVATGTCNAASLESLRNAESMGLLDPDDPLASPLLTKPLDEDIGGVEHGGGPKLHSTDEPTYLDFAYFAQRWADCQVAK